MLLMIVPVALALCVRLHGPTLAARSTVALPATRREGGVMWDGSLLQHCTAAPFHPQLWSVPQCARAVRAPAGRTLGLP